jgi:hypothetical protein
MPYNISKHSPRRWLALFAPVFAFAALGVLGAERASALENNVEKYASPQDAVAGLVGAVRSDDAVTAIVKVLGPEGAEIASSGDAIDDEARRARFLRAFDVGHKIEQDEPTKATLLIGNDEYPFPIPLVSNDGKWYWDTDSGLDEILSRRIGENEINTIEVMRTYVAAQLEYAEEDRDGKGVQYARRLMSREGRKDGLYWPVSGSEDESPIGPLIAKAQREGYKPGSSQGEQPAYHGYVYRILYGQGSNASDGARDYILNGRMIGGFALVASPAEYGNSGIMTFIVNQDGDVYEKDLGPDTTTEAQKIKLFNPVAGWSKVELD